MPKIKYTEEIKKAIVEEIIDNKKSKKWLSRETGIDETTIRKWVMAYEENGLEGLKIRQNAHKKYNGEFKLNVVKYKLEKSMSSKQTAAYFNIATGVSVDQWEKKYKEGGAEALFEEKRGRSSKMPKEKKTHKTQKPPQTEKELLEKIRMLEMENEYLKKLNALVQQRKN